MTSSGTTAESARSIACQIDGIDTCILNMLEKDGRATLAQLSEATGLSVSAVQSRVQKLERRGVISGYKAIIDDEKRGLPVSAYIAVIPTDYACESEIPGNCTMSMASCRAIPWPARPATCSPCVRNRQASSKSCSTSFTKPFR